MLIEPCRIEMFGILTVHHQGRVLTHFATRKSAALLAYLAFFAEQAHARELLLDRFWPDMESEAARHNLRQTLFSLRRLLEPSGVPAGSLLFADRTSVRLSATSVRTDVGEFRDLLQMAAGSASAEQRLAGLEQAVALYKSGLLPDMYENWALMERERLAAACHEALDTLATLYHQEGRAPQALDCLRRLVSAEPFNAAAQERLIRLYASCGQAERAREQYHSFVGILSAEWNETPPRELRAFVEALPSAPLFPSIPLLPAPLPRLPDAPEPLRIPSPRLPVPLTRFFGRENELREAQSLLTAPQRCLLTLLGMGGSGKTRLAVELGHRVSGEFQNGVCFVSLGELTAADMLPDAILNALGATPIPSTLPLEQIRNALDAKRTLLILDNVEHLLPAAAPLILALLEQSPALSCLVTSRQKLQIAGERILNVLPLPIPTEMGREHSRHSNAASLRACPPDANPLACPSVAMFVDRAQATRAGFTLTRRNSQAVVALCRRLEGIPLAIELAAARIGVLTPQQMVTQLENRFALLVSKQQGLSPRHQSLRATVEWSYALLGEPQQSALAALCIFRGGWFGEAAQALCPDLPMLDLLQQLCENSLILAQERGDKIRFTMLETVREYAQECLSREEAAQLAARHADYFGQMLKAAQGEQDGEQETAWHDILETEHDNLLAALAWKRENADLGAYLTLVLQMWSFWYTRGHYWEARTRLTEALAREVGREPLLRARTLNSAGTLAWYQGDYKQAQTWLDEALALNRQENFAPGVVNTLTNQSLVWRDQGKFSEAHRCAEEALTLSRQTNNEHAVIYSLFSLGSIALLQTDYTGAQTLLSECVTLRRKAKDLWGLGHTLNLMGELADALGETEQAEACFQESLAIFTPFGDKQGLSGARQGLGKVELHRGDWNAARDYLRASLRLRHETGNRAGIVANINGLAALACGLCQWEQTARLLGWVEAQDIPACCPGDSALRDSSADAASAALGGIAYATAFQQGRGLNGEQAFRLAENL